MEAFLWTYRTFRDDFPFAVGTQIDGKSDNGGHALFDSKEVMERYIRAWQADYPDGRVMRGMAT